MRYPSQKFGLVAGVAGTLALAVMTPSAAAPVYNGAAALRSAVASDVVDVRWHGRGGRGGWAAGAFVGGLALGALAARPYYYSDPYYYGPTYYPPPVVYAPPPGPAYVEPYADPNGPTRQCWVSTDADRGFGYFRPC
jgi:hypothetical protein